MSPLFPKIKDFGTIITLADYLIKINTILNEHFFHHSILLFLDNPCNYLIALNSFYQSNYVHYV